MKRYSALFLATLLLLTAAWLPGCGKAEADRVSDRTSASDPSPSPEPSNDEPEKLPSEEPSPDSASADASSDAASAAKVDDGILRYRLVKGEYYEVSGVSAVFDYNTEEIEIPATLNGLPVKKISCNSSAFDAFALTSLKIPEGVTEISANAFASCASLTEITLPASLTKLGEDALHCVNLRAIQVADGNESFRSTDGILFSADGETLIKYPPKKEETAYEVPKTVKKISPSAFRDCNTLTSILLSEGVSSIGDKAFYRCTALTDIQIPKSVKQIVLLDLFAGCNSLTAITVEEGCTACKAVDGVLFSADGQTLFHYPALKEGAAYSIPDGVKIVIPAAFDNNKLLQTLSIPKSVEKIDTGVSSFLANLAAVNVEEGCTVCKSIDGVLFSADGTTLLLYPKERAGERYVIPEGVTAIESGAFYAPSYLKTLSLPTSYTEFARLGISRGLAAMETAAGHGTLKAVDGMLLDAAGETLLLCPPEKAGSCRVPDGVKTISTFAFEGCEKLTSILLPEGLAEIGGYAFWNCTGLAVIEIPASVQKGLDYDTFSGCAGLTAINVAEGCEAYKSEDGVLFTAKGDMLIQYPAAKPDESYRVPDGVKRASAATLCSDHLKSLTLPASLTTLGENSPRHFWQNLESVQVEEGSHYYSSKDGLLLDRNGFTLLYYPPAKPDTDYTLPEGIEFIDTDAIFDVFYLKTLRLPAGLRQIAELGISIRDVYASRADCALTEIYLPDGIKQIDKYGILLDGGKIYCASTEKPEDWSERWLDSDAEVVWGYDGGTN